jgi:hypothetical protein
MTLVDPTPPTDRIASKTALLLDQSWPHIACARLLAGLRSRRRTRRPGHRWSAPSPLRAADYTPRLSHSLCMGFQPPRTRRYAHKSRATRGSTFSSLVLPIVQGVSGSTSEVPTGLRDLLASCSSSPSMKVVPLDTRLASQAGDEATQKGCEPLLLVTLTRKAGAGKRHEGAQPSEPRTKSDWSIACNPPPVSFSSARAPSIRPRASTARI